MSDLLLPFAQRVSDGQLVSPDEVPRGLACNCVCLGCNHPVQAKQGTERIWHFAHAKAGDCAGAYEKSVHEAAKQMMRDRKELWLPALSVTFQAVDAFHRPQVESESIFEQRLVHLDSCKAGQVIDGVAPDLVGVLRDRQLLIEVTVFHRLMPEKRERLQATGLAILELDLSEFKTKQATREGLQAALFDRYDNRRWVWHPARAEAEERVREKLRQRLAATELEWAEQEKKMRAEQAAHRAKLEAARIPVRVTPQFSEGISWRAYFPSEELWSPARAAFCERHALPREQVDAVFGSMVKRSDLARTTPKELAPTWAVQLGVEPEDIFRYFAEGGYLS